MMADRKEIHAIVQSHCDREGHHRKHIPYMLDLSTIDLTEPRPTSIDF